MEFYRSNPLWAELVQLIPVIVLACSFLVSGEVDLSRAGPLFLLSAALTVPVTALLAARGHVLNPILLGANLWLWLGTLAFWAPLPRLADWLIQSRAVGLFALALGVGLVATFATPEGYIGHRHPDQRWIGRASALLLALTALALAWSWALRDDLRLGGGLPFIALNLARRGMILRAQRQGRPQGRIVAGSSTATP